MGVNIFDEPQKCTSLAVFMHCEPLIVRIRSPVFSLCECMKRDATKSHREVIFHLFAGNSPPNQIQLKLAYE